MINDGLERCYIDDRLVHPFCIRTRRIKYERDRPSRIAVSGDFLRFRIANLSQRSSWYSELA